MSVNIFNVWMFYLCISFNYELFLIRLFVMLGQRTHTPDVSFLEKYKCTKLRLIFIVRSRTFRDHRLGWRLLRSPAVGCSSVARSLALFRPFLFGIIARGVESESVESHVFWWSRVGFSDMMESESKIFFRLHNPD